MSRGINKVILIGNLGQDPQQKTLPSGQRVTNVGLATTEGYKDKQGEWQEKTTWHDLAFWGADSDNITKYAKKGTTMYVEGSLEKRKAEGGGYFVTVNVKVFRFVDSKPASSSDNTQGEAPEIDPNDDIPF